MGAVSLLDHREAISTKVIGLVHLVGDVVEAGLGIFSEIDAG